MRKYLIGGAIILSLLPAFAFADSMTIVPSSEQTGSEASMNISYSGSETFVVFYIFNPSGISVQNAAGEQSLTGSSTFAGSWTAGGLPVGLATGTYDVVGLHSGSSGDYSGWNSNYCGVGKTSSTCSTAFGTRYTQTDTKVTITSAPTPPPPIILTTAQGKLSLYELVWVAIVIFSVAFAVYLIERLVIALFFRPLDELTNL